MDARADAAQAAERVARESYGRLVAFLAARTRDIAGAEDALAEAFAAALATWPVDGVPHNPDAWLLTVARRRQTDAIRRRRTRDAGEEHVKLIADEVEAAANAGDVLPDRRLGLMFACAHPAIERGMRAPLILQTILGLTAIDIAAAFLVSPATMGQRLVRAKQRIQQAGIPFAIPDLTELPDRLDAVLDAIYAAYGKGWNEFGDAEGTALADEAIWLARLIVSLLPDQPEARGMLALMLYTSARNPARRDPTGAYVPLDRQDTGLWDLELIDAAEEHLQRASHSGPSGRYQLEAAIQSAHVARRLVGADTAAAVLAIYDHLLDLTHSPVVALNRAVALAEVEGPAAGLAALDTVANDARMATYQPYWAARGHLSAEAGRHEDAHNELTLALGLATDAAVRRYLADRLAALTNG
jgi:RNA polymerase sigma-70 factor, ECF subfamily